MFDSLAALVVAAALLQADGSSGVSRAPGPIVAPPIRALDPEHPAPIVGWWTNGEQLLEVAPDGAYRLFPTQNRYRKPAEVGRWHRQNYAAFWLSPYSMRKEERTRAALSEVNGAIVVTVRNLKPMRWVETAPSCEEDLFIGMWSGRGGSLELAPNMRYRFAAPRLAGSGTPVVISSHRGVWRLIDGQVELLPDSPSVATQRLDPEATAEGFDSSFTVLRGVEGTLERVELRDPAVPGPVPASGDTSPQPTRDTPTAPASLNDTATTP